MANYSIESLNDSEIVIYSLYNTLDQTVDEFTAMLNTKLDAWNASRPYLVVIDISHQDIRFNQYAYQQLKTTFENIPAELRGAVAFIMPDNIFHTMAQTYLNKLPDCLVRLEHSMFKHVDLAIHWLIETSVKYYVAS